MKCRYFWVKISVYIKINPFFCNLTAKVLKFIVIKYLVLNLMLHYSTNIYLVVFTNKFRQNIFIFASKSDIVIFRYILRNACFAITLPY